MEYFVELAPHVSVVQPERGQRLIDALSEIVQEDSLGAWLQQPNDAFDGLKPIEVIDRGHSDRLWEMIFNVRSGTAS